MSTDPKALLRTEMIVKVRAGLMTATAAAEALGVSRKTYYKWEKRGLQAMLAAGEAETPGRHSKEESAEVRALKRKVESLTAKVEHLAETGNLRVMLLALERQDAKKKRTQSEE
jgi:transposase